MTYASDSKTAADRGGAAIWDIFPADATHTINQFLQETTKRNANAIDPILSQAYYLTKPQLDELAKKYGIFPWRVYQNPGDAVFIPAGCAHQVYPHKLTIYVRCVI
jgi:[histone H3]-dimethyl-L-lysine9 demethylase